MAGFSATGVRRVQTGSIRHDLLLGGLRRGLCRQLSLLGMCGGFACALGRDPRGRGATVLRHLLYNSGRLTTYCFLGALAGALGQVVCTRQGTTFLLLDGSLDAAAAHSRDYRGTAHDRDGVAILRPAAGHFIALRSASPAAHLPCRCAACWRRAAARRRSLLGCSMASCRVRWFMPLPPKRRAPSRALSGFLTMASFGLGTFPAMLMMGGVGRVLAPAWRQRGVWFAGSCILLLGMITLGRGILPIGRAHRRMPGREAIPHEPQGRKLVRPLLSARRPRARCGAR